MMRVLLLALLACLLLGGRAEAGCPPLPYVFVPGTTADANQVNANFNAVTTCAGAGSITVANLTALRAACTSTTGCPAGHLVFLNGVIRLTDGVAGAPPLYFSVGSGACSTDDGASCVNSSNGASWIGQFSGPADVREWSANCNNTADAGPQINAALSSGIKSIFIPAVVCASLSQTIIVPDSVEFFQKPFNSNPNSSPRGQIAGIRCAVLVCIQAGNNDNGTPIVHDLTIFRTGSPGSAPSGSVCIQWLGDANVVPRNIWCQNNAIEYQIKSTGTAGAYFFGTNLFTCGTTDADVDIVQVPGVYLQGGALGCNGAFDVNSNDVIRIEGNWDAAKGTLGLNQVQINKGQNAATCGIDLKNFTGSTNQFLDLMITGGHIETVDSILCSDSSVASIGAFHLSDFFTVGGNGGNHALAFNAATSVEFTDIHDITFFGWADLALAPNSLLSQLKIHHNDFQMPVHITGTNNVLWMDGNTYNGTVTIDGTWASGNVSGNFVGGSQIFSDSALQNLDIRVPNVACTLNLAIGGSSSGITYSESTFQHCDLANKKLNVQYFLPIESLGGLTGAATITGLPFRGNNVALAQAPVLTSNLITTGVSGVFVGPQATQHFLTISAYTSTGNVTPLANPVFANANGSCTTTCPILSGEVSYTVGGN